VEGDGFSLFLDLVGSGRGPGARVRRWSAIVFILMLVMGGIAVYMWLGTVPKKVDAADIETGQALPPSVKHRGYRGRRYAIPYEVKGHVLNSEGVTVDWRGERWIYAPLVSDNGSPDNPRLYFGATEASYKRSRAENRFVGVLEPDVFGFVRKRLEAAGVSPPSDVVFLEDNGTLRAGAASAVSLMVFALVGALISLVVFLMAMRRARPDDDDDAAGSTVMPSPLPASRGEGT
jgi:hypothetical protein